MKLWLHYIGINIRSELQYKTSFILTVIGQFLVSFTTFLGIVCMFDRFHSVKGYSFSEICLCSGTFLLSYSLAEMFFRGFDSFSDMIRHADFDRILLRPRNLMLQVLGSKFALNRIGRIVQAGIMFVYGITVSKVAWTPLKIITLLNMILCGALLFCGIFIIYAALCFFTLDGLETMNCFTDGAKEHGKYPVDIYGRKFLLFATYGIPYALVQYYPLQYLLGRDDRMFLAVVPYGVLLFLIPCYLLWKIGVRHYTSSGS